MKLIVTTTQHMTERDTDLEVFLTESRLPFVPRNRLSLERLNEAQQVDGIIVWEASGPVLYVKDEKFFFHPNMAKNRIAFFRNLHTPDIMIHASHVERGDSFLDCTLGLGADSIVASYFSGTGRITGLEHQPAIAHVIRWGMKRYRTQMPWLQEAIQRIEVIAADHREYLPGLDDQSYDIVYFDPMFQKPLLKSRPISPLRQLADHDPLELAAIKEACRVARKRVVMKDLASGEELERLGFEKIRRSKYNKLAYGVINV